MRSLIILLTSLGLVAMRSQAREQTPTILVLGDSLTAGYGIDPEEAYPALLQKRIKERGLPHRVVNAGISGDTTAGGLRRIEWLLRQRVDVLVLALGANDGLRGLPPDRIQRNLVAIVEKTRAKYPNAWIILGGMQMPSNLGADYVRSYRDVFPAVAKETGAVLIPFFLEGVAGVPGMNLEDRIHPNPAGQQLLARNVWTVLEPVLQTQLSPAR